MKGLSGCLGRSLIILLSFGAIIWGLWSWFAPTAVVRYRLDVTVEVDGEPVTGSVVQELTISTWPFHLPGNARVGYRIKGQALVLDLPGRGTLFVLMELPTEDGSFPTSNWGERFRSLVNRSCDLKRNGTNFAAYVRKFRSLSGSCNVPRQYIPLMVQFEDLADQTSVERVYPDDLEAAFGSNIKFINASITFTDAPITTGIGQHLPWLTNYIERYLGEYSRTYPKPFYRSLMYGSFRKNSI
ncbi:hypothetical protein [Labrenzia sp. CE80]|uniref:hypothetical protein n=1 Tax=Labrenzia sp. CE80 TaxID=1788986 RepID=UPI00129B7CE7|nr:hypothetical protein [Labrenzia sp. CE80]